MLIALKSDLLTINMVGHFITNVLFLARHHDTAYECTERRPKDFYLCGHHYLPVIDYLLDFIWHHFIRHHYMFKNI